MKEIIKKLSLENKSIYLLGTTDENLKACVANILRDYPRINISGYHNGFFDLDNPRDFVKKFIDYDRRIRAYE